MTNKITNYEYSLATKAAWLSNVENKTLSEIARYLNISTAKVHRLISTAEKNGYVKAWVASYPEDCIAKAQQIMANFSLASCQVVPDKELNEQQSIDITGYAAAKELYAWLSRSKVKRIGVGQGRTLKSMARSLPSISCPGVDFVAISGSIKQNHAIMKEDVIHDLVTKTQAKGFLLPHPYFALNQDKKNIFLAQPSILALHEKALTSERIVVGIDDVINNSIFTNNHLLDEQLWQKVLQQQAVAGFFGTLLDIDGQAIDAANDLALGIKIAEILKCQTTVCAVVGGKSKGKAAVAALRTGAITDLIIGETSADFVLNY
ncbi:sugar-binding transcriptional regulator [Thalassotalea sp. ND16A]|uniref:sugar-binding transcriptional regulator n=1 Tax=Thalassotalea sp. ND16A TaxID=1535422 RepID=UPI00051A2847|nr:sugar-binding domain-containing protein [Thalassotalea sp. ND16A]KGJ98436.1 hypothetical protein ND16A_0745 [Thalassotalea sp. ND16A]